MENPKVSPFIEKSLEIAQVLWRNSRESILETSPLLLKEVW
jgi:hypothetical protein